MTSMGERRGSYNGLDEIPEEKGHLEDISVDRRIILKWVFKKSVGTAWTGLTLLHIGISGRLL